MCTPCLVISGLLFHCQQWSLGNYTEKKNNDIFRCRNNHFSFSTKGARENKKERKLLRTRKKYKQNFCVRKSGNDYFHHDGNEFSIPLYSPGWCSLHWPVHPQWRPHSTTVCVCWWRTQVHCVALDPPLQMSTVNMEIHVPVNTSIFIYSRTSFSSIMHYIVKVVSYTGG